MRKVTSLSLAAALLGAASMAGGALTAERAEAFDGKCYGIAKAGENDCANAVGSHACAGLSTVDFSGAEWRRVADAEACRLAGGRSEPFVGANSKLMGGS